MTFIDWGYKAYDATLGFIKKVGGSGLVKIFEHFSGVVGTVIETLIYATIALSSQANQIFDMVSGFIGDKLMKRAAKRGTKEVAGALLKQGATTAATETTKTGAKFGFKNLMRIIGPRLGSLPVIGGLVEFVLSWAMGDPIGKAAFKGVGSGLGMWAGMAIMGLIGTVAGLGVGFV